MKDRVLNKASNLNTMHNYIRTAKNRAQVEHRAMVVWEHQGRDGRPATNYYQVLPDDMNDPPDGWVAVATIDEQLTVRTE